ncbi:hypothetical protein ES695_14350 [Candidatus Atribacteria bacterium 1244-E10-H5-B2]|nr:MAG: hypothetical protein ES695_14350 [Candidatus Atribacteria bacterium 1244-E10-H5-B2]
MLVVSIFKKNAEYLAGRISAVSFESCKRRLKLYFSNLNKVKERIIAGEIVDIPYVTFQRDRRSMEKKKIKIERRTNLN